MQGRWIFVIAVVSLALFGDFIALFSTTHLQQTHEHAEAPPPPTLNDLLAARSLDKRVHVSYCAA